MSGFVGDLSAKQEVALADLKAELKDVPCEQLDSDSYILRWLRARRFDVQKAKQMIITHCEWREQNQVDSILKDYKKPDVLQKYYQGGFCGHDKTGCPTWIDPIGLSDPKGLAKCVTNEEVIRMKICQLEYIHSVLLPQRSKEEDKEITQTVIIFDLAHFGMKHLWKPGVDLFCDILAMSEANYPETMRKTFIVNAPAFFPIVFAIVKPFLNEDTVKKVQVYGENFKQVLLKHFDSENLPQKYGGTKTDINGDPNCTADICYGGTVPQSYYKQAVSGNGNESEEVIVLHGASISLEYNVADKGAVLSVEFTTAEHDIAFAVLRKATSAASDQQELEEVIPMSRVDAHVTVQKSKIECDKTGIYVVRFDNSYSWHRDKRLTYRVSVEYHGKTIGDCLGDTSVTVENEEVEEILSTKL